MTGGLLARPDITLVHLRNAGHGCDNFAARRSDAAPPAPGGAGR